MKKLLLIMSFITACFQLQAQTEKVEFDKNTYQCFYCKKTFSLPYLPVIKSIKNEKIKNALDAQLQRTMAFFNSPTKNSECMSNLNKSSQHDWRLMKPKKAFYTATMVRKEINGEMVEYADVPDWKTFDDTFNGN